MRIVLFFIWTVFLAGCSVKGHLTFKDDYNCPSSIRQTNKRVAILDNSDMANIILEYGHYALGDGKAKMNIYPGINDYFKHGLSCTYNNVEIVKEVPNNEDYDILFYPNYVVNIENIEKYSKHDPRLQNQIINVNNLTPTISMEIVDNKLNRIEIFKSHEYVSSTQEARKHLDNTNIKKALWGPVAFFGTAGLMTPLVQISIGNDYMQALQSNVDNNTKKYYE